MYQSLQIPGCSQSGLFFSVAMRLRSLDIAPSRCTGCTAPLVSVFLRDVVGCGSGVILSGGQVSCRVSRKSLYCSWDMVDLPYCLYMMSEIEEALSLLIICIGYITDNDCK
jgi:hypothetical protein